MRRIIRNVSFTFVVILTSVSSSWATDPTSPFELPNPLNPIDIQPAIHWPDPRVCQMILGLMPIMGPDVGLKQFNYCVAKYVETLEKDPVGALFAAEQNQNNPLSGH